VSRIAEASAIVDRPNRNIDWATHEAEIRAALDRVVASVHLSKSPQLGNFLRFVVEETLAGRADRIKVYSIAADALGRDADFDADHDPIVHVSAGCGARSTIITWTAATMIR
jgi:hypothetical protein